MSSAGPILLTLFFYPCYANWSIRNNLPMRMRSVTHLDKFYIGLRVEIDFEVNNVNTYHYRINFETRFES
jgi:hypothetical protein